jgi:hypothetical protein
MSSPCYSSHFALARDAGRPAVPIGGAGVGHRTDFQDHCDRADTAPYQVSYRRRDASLEDPAALGDKQTHSRRARNGIRDPSGPGGLRPGVLCRSFFEEKSDFAAVIGPV